MEKDDQDAWEILKAVLCVDMRLSGMLTLLHAMSYLRNRNAFYRERVPLILRQHTRESRRLKGMKVYHANRIV